MGLVKGTYGLLETAKILNVSKNVIYRAVAEGQIKVVRIGRRLRVPRAWIEQQLKAD